tara:strand:- start:30087 stop:30722 length:636 start_codon:yes stop_codon:yes gene_type:complete
MKNHEIESSYIDFDRIDDYVNEEVFNILTLVILLITYIILWHFIPFNFLLIHFITFLYFVTDKKVYSDLIEAELVQPWYIKYKKEKIIKDIKKYEIEDQIANIFNRKKDNVIVIQTRSTSVKIYKNPFDNCQSISIANFKKVLDNQVSWKKVLKEIQSKVNKRQIIVDINQEYNNSFNNFALMYNLQDVQKMNYISSNGSSMILIKFIIND